MDVPSINRWNEVLSRSIVVSRTNFFLSSRKSSRKTTYEDHYLTTKQLVEILKTEYNLPTHRQTIAEEIKSLQLMGMDIDVYKSTQNRIRLLSRKFEQAELKLLIDAVASSKFISAQQSIQLTEKLGELASCYKAEELKRNILVEGKVKTSNKKVPLIIDAVNNAINVKRKIAFYSLQYIRLFILKLRSVQLFH